MMAETLMTEYASRPVMVVRCLVSKDIDLIAELSFCESVTIRNKLDEIECERLFFLHGYHLSLRARRMASLESNQSV